MTWDCFEHKFYFLCIKIEFQKVAYFLDTTFDDKDLPKFLTKKWKKNVTNSDNAKRNKTVVFKNNAPFINCISKINGEKFDNAEDSDVVMPMYNLLEYSKNYRKTTGSLWNYYRDEPRNKSSVF